MGWQRVLILCSFWWNASHPHLTTCCEKCCASCTFWLFTQATSETLCSEAADRNRHFSWSMLLPLNHKGAGSTLSSLSSTLPSLLLSFFISAWSLHGFFPLATPACFPVYRSLLLNHTVKWLQLGALRDFLIAKFILHLQRKLTPVVVLCGSKLRFKWFFPLLFLSKNQRGEKKCMPHIFWLIWAWLIPASDRSRFCPPNSG